MAVACAKALAAIAVVAAAFFAGRVSSPAPAAPIAPAVSSSVLSPAEGGLGPFEGNLKTVECRPEDNRKLVDPRQAVWCVAGNSVPIGCETMEAMNPCLRPGDFDSYSCAVAAAMSEVVADRAEAHQVVFVLLDLRSYAKMFFAPLQKYDSMKLLSAQELTLDDDGASALTEMVLRNTRLEKLSLIDLKGMPSGKFDKIARHVRALVNLREFEAYRQDRPGRTVLSEKSAASLAALVTRPSMQKLVIGNAGVTTAVCEAFEAQLRNNGPGAALITLNLFSTRCSPGAVASLTAVAKEKGVTWVTVTAV